MKLFEGTIYKRISSAFSFNVSCWLFTICGLLRHGNISFLLYMEELIQFSIGKQWSLKKVYFYSSKYIEWHQSLSITEVRWAEREVQRMWKWNINCDEILTLRDGWKIENSVKQQNFSNGWNKSLTAQQIQYRNS